MTNNRGRILLLKHCSYILMFLLLFVLQSTPRFLTIHGVRPILLLPACVVLAMFEGGFVGGLYGAFAGILCDLGSFSFYGLYSVLLLVCATICGLLAVLLMQRTLRVALLLTLGVSSLCILMRFVFEFGLWNYENTALVFFGQSLPTLIFTVLFTPAFFFLQTGLTRFFDSKINVDR